MDNEIIDQLFISLFSFKKEQNKSSAHTDENMSTEHKL